MNQNFKNQFNNMNNLTNNQINQINMQNNMLNYMQANIISNYQAELMRMNYISNIDHLNSNLYSPYISLPYTENSIVELLEKFFSEKNLNKDLNLRKNMDENTGNVPIDFILNLNKIRLLNLTEEKLEEIINKIGSDNIEIITIEDKIYLRPKNFDKIKDKLKSVDDMEKEYQYKLNQQKQKQQNIPTMNPQPVAFYPVQPFMYYGQMMMAPPQQNLQNQPGFIYPVPIANNGNTIQNNK